MAKYKVETKIEVVEYVIKQNKSYGEASKKYNIDKSAIRKWVAAYEHHGTEGIVTKRKSYSGEYKISVIEYMHDNGLSARKTAAIFNIPTYTTVCKWERIYYEKGASALLEERRGRKRKDMSKKTIKPKIEQEEDLIAELQRLRMENEYLKKLNALIQEKEKLTIKTKQ